MPRLQIQGYSEIILNTLNTTIVMHSTVNCLYMIYELAAKYMSALKKKNWNLHFGQHSFKYPCL